MDTEYFYVNGVKCLGEWNLPVSVKSCFGEPGYYEVKVQSKHTSLSYGMAFKLVETYPCPEKCSDCLGATCCASNSVISGGACVCPDNSVLADSACTCIEGYSLDTSGDLPTCTRIPLIIPRENVVSSQAGLQISCDGTGHSITVASSQYDDENDISDADWIWTSNGEDSYDYCTVTVAFLRHSYSSIHLQFDSEDDKAFYVNGQECFVDDEDFVDQDVTSCFGEVGYYELIFLSEHTVGSFGMAFRVSESYLCGDSCFDCVGEQCCVQGFGVEGEVCVAPAGGAGGSGVVGGSMEARAYDGSADQGGEQLVGYSELIVFMITCLGIGFIALMGAKYYAKRRGDNEGTDEFRYLRIND